MSILWLICAEFYLVVDNNVDDDFIVFDSSSISVASSTLFHTIVGSHILKTGNLNETIYWCNWYDSVMVCWLS